MTRLHRAGLVLLASLLATSATATASASAAAVTSPDAVVEKPTERTGRFLYRASFNATVTSDLKLVSPGPNNDDVRHMSASISGTHEAIEISTTNEDLLIPRSMRSSVGVDTATVTTTERINDGQYVQTCSGDSATIEGPSHPLPHPYFDGFSAFRTHTNLNFSAACTDTDGQTGTALYAVTPKETIDLANGSARPGARVITYALSYKRGTAPLHSAEYCPGYEVGPDNTCSYTVKGILTLTLIKELKPPKGSAKASVTKGATKAAAQVQCPAACRVDIEVLPLRGSSRVLARERLSLQAPQPTNVWLPIPARNRTLAVRSGGVRIRITYRVPGVPAFVEIREARL
jgi:hypothetical protein